MRDFIFEGANTSAADIAGPRPVIEDVPQSLVVEDTFREESPFREDVIVEDSSGMRPFHAEQDNDEEPSNLPKYLGAAAVVAILAVGGGIYAYELSTGNQVPKTVAMKTVAAPAKLASNQPVAPTPPAALSDNNTPAAAPAPAVVKSAHATPAPVAAAPEQQAAAAPAKPGVGIGPTDDAAINAPMTFTADNAPPAQQAGSSSEVAQAAPAALATPAPADQAAANPAPADQTASMQQPVTAPNVGSNSQPTASVAQLPQHTLQPSIQPAP